MLDIPDPQYPFLKIENIIQQYMETPPQIERDYPGLNSGIRCLDDFTGGFYPGELIVVSGYPFMGQEAFLESLALNVAFKQKTPVAYFSLGKKRWKLAERLLAKMAQVDPARLATGCLREEDKEKIKTAQNDFQGMPLYINDSNGITVHEIRRHLDECLDGEYGVRSGLVIVDYLQLIQGWEEAVTRKEEIGAILRELEDLAHSRNVPLVLHSLFYPSCRGDQINDSREKPILADLLRTHETAMIDKYADTVMFFNRELLHWRDGGPEPDNSKLQVIIEKSRNGCVGSVYFDFAWIAGSIQ